MVNTIKESVMGSKEISILASEKHFVDKINLNSMTYAKLNIYQFTYRITKIFVGINNYVSIDNFNISNNSINQNPINTILPFNVWDCSLRLAPCATQIIRGITNIKFYQIQ